MTWRGQPCGGQAQPVGKAHHPESRQLDGKVNMATVPSVWRERRAAPSPPPPPTHPRARTPGPPPQGARGERAVGGERRPTSPPGRPVPPGPGRGPSPRQKIAGPRLTSEFELVLRLEAQDLLHLRHVPRRRDTSGGETPERSPEAGDVNAAPPLNSKGGGRPGVVAECARREGRPTRCKLGGGGRGRGHGAQ